MDVICQLLTVVGLLFYIEATAVTFISTYVMLQMYSLSTAKGYILHHARSETMRDQTAGSWKT